MMRRLEGGRVRDGVNFGPVTKESVGCSLLGYCQASTSAALSLIEPLSYFKK